MENNEDELDDVKKATPVESAILDGNKDEKMQNVKGKKPKSAPVTLDHRKGSKVGRCNLYKGKFPPPVIKTKKPCHPKAEIICRDNLSKDEYIEVLSTPKQSRGLSCKQAKVEPTDSPNRRFASGRKPSCKEKAVSPRPMSQRLEELAKPRPSYVMDLLQSWGSRLRPEIIDSVQKSLEENCAMSLEQMEAYYNEKDREDCNQVRRVRRKKCPGEKVKKKSPCDDRMDRQAVCEEYEMAQRFMRHIISHIKNCQFASEDYYDLTEVILTQLGSVLDYRPSGDGDRKFQMMFMLANGIACWAHGLNIAVTAKLAKQQSRDVKEEIDAEESEDEDEDGEEEEEESREEVAEAIGGEEEEEEEEESREEVAEAIEGEKEEDEEDGGNEKEDIEESQEEETKENTEVKNESIQYEMVDEMGMENGVENDNEVTAKPNEDIEAIDTDQGADIEVNSQKEEVTKEIEVEEEFEELAGAKEETEREAELSVLKDLKEEGEMEGEIEEAKTETMEAMTTTEEETIADNPSIHSTIEPGLAIKRLGEDDLFASEIPFITFGKIMEIVVKFLDKFEEAETTEVRRRLQNAILKKLTKLVLAEAPHALDNNMKAVLEVLAENIAVFMEDTLPITKVNDIETMAPEIESTEVRSWGHWLETVMDNATNWGKWIHEKVVEAEEKARTKVTRGDWQDWTSTVNSEALRWRMFNLDTKHRMHHADLNLTHKKVVHRGGIGSGNVTGIGAMLAPYPEKDETEIKAYDLFEEAKSLDQNAQIRETDYEEPES